MSAGRPPRWGGDQVPEADRPDAGREPGGPGAEGPAQTGGAPGTAQSGEPGVAVGEPGATQSGEPGAAQSGEPSAAAAGAPEAAAPGLDGAGRGGARRGVGGGARAGAGGPLRGGVRGAGAAGPAAPGSPEGLFWTYEVDLAGMLAAIGGVQAGDPGDEEAFLAEERAAEEAGPGAGRDLTGVIADQLPAGPGLAGWLASADPAGLSDWDLPGVAAAYRRVASWAQAGELSAVAAIASRSAARDRRAEVDEEGRPDRVTPSAASEVSLALVMSQVGASWWADLAVTLGWRLRAAGAALAAGTIDLGRARLVAEATAPLSDEGARAVEGLVLPGAGGQSTGQLRAALRRAVLRVDPAGAEDRRQAAERQAKVSLYPDDAGTATLVGSNLPGVHAAAAMARLTALARGMKAAGKGGGIDLLRAQVLIGLVLGTLPFIPAPPGAPPDTPPDPGDPPGDPRPGGGGDDGPGPGADDGPGPGDPPGAGRGPDDAGGPGGPDDTGGPGGPGASGSAPGGSGGAGSHPADRGPGGRPGPVSGDPGDPGDRGRGGRGGPAGGPGGHRRPPGLAADDPPPRDRPPGRSSRPGRRPGARPARPDNTGPPGGPGPQGQAPDAAADPSRPAPPGADPPGADPPGARPPGARPPGADSCGSGVPGPGVPGPGVPGPGVPGPDPGGAGDGDQRLPGAGPPGGDGSFGDGLPGSGSGPPGGYQAREP